MVVRRPIAGFTLLECLIVLAILAILGATTIPQVGAISGQWRLRSAGIRLSAELVRARWGALRAAEPWTVRPTTTGLRIEKGQNDVATVALPPGIMVSVNSGGDVRFLPNGSAENATFRLVNAWGERRVVVNQRGRVRLD